MFAWLAVGLALAGILFVGLAAKPRQTESSQRAAASLLRRRGRVLPEVVATEVSRRVIERGRDEYDKAIASAPAGEYEKRLEEQIWVLSHIASRKYRLVSTGMRLFAIAGVAALIAFIVENRGSSCST